jgi:hypothetical protein
MSQTPIFGGPIEVEDETAEGREDPGEGDDAEGEEDGDAHRPARRDAEGEEDRDRDEDERPEEPTPARHDLTSWATTCVHSPERGS